MDNSMILNQIRMASTSLSDGLSSDDFSILSRELEKLIQTVLKPTYKRMPPDLEETVLWTGQRIINEVSKISPGQRIEYINLEILSTEIGQLDWECKKTAEESLLGLPDMWTLKMRAKENLEKVQDYYELLKKKGPVFEKRFGRVLSEARNDCEFVLGVSENSSLRLGRVIKNLQQNNAWPPDWYKELWMKDK